MANKASKVSWPYNLMNAVGKNNPDTEDYVKGVEYALDRILDREEECILLYFREGLTYSEIGQRYGLTDSRIQRIVRNGIQHLRYPSRLDYVLFGFENTNKRLEELRQRAESLRKCELELDRLEREIRDRKEQLKRYEENPLLAPDDFGSIASLSIDEMELSDRAYNCLRRAGCTVLGEVVNLIKSEKLFGIRGLGKKTLAEILQRVYNLTGRDYSEIYKSNTIPKYAKRKKTNHTISDDCQKHEDDAYDDEEWLDPYSLTGYNVDFVEEVEPYEDEPDE